jgi:hypothetical protein
MKKIQQTKLWLGTFLCAFPFGLLAQLEILPDKAPQRVFAGEARKIPVTWHNADDKSAGADVRMRLYQTSSAMAAPLYEKAWKKIEILPGQTVLESAPLDFPAVNAETQFLIQWLEGTNQVVGKTEVLVYPTNLLAELKILVGEENFGVLDPNNELKPLLKQNHVEFSDLGETALEDFQGKLAIIGPFSTNTQMREGLAQTIQKIARKGAAIVWLQPPPGPKDQIKPSFYIVPEGKGSVVVVQADLVARLPENPKSQLNLVYFCKLALNPMPFFLPDLKTQP